MIAAIRYILYIFIIIVTITTFLPFGLIRPFNPKNSKFLLRYFGFLVETFIGMKVHLEGEENLDKGHPGIIAGNHQHNYDAYTVFRLFQNDTVILGKFELGLIPVFGWTYSLAGNILIRRGNPKKAMASMNAMEKKIQREKLNLLIFPEGTRNPSDTLLPFKRGAFYTAVNTGFPIIPFSMSKFLQLNNFNSFKKVHVFVKVHPPIPTTGLKKDDIPKLMEDTKNVIAKGILEMNQKHKEFLNK